ncbi:hypothetical protein [Streptomyces sp. NBC_01789]|uniref:hypothetical protein n=1 Tax=Streptomyces sp. NBC_01789 TaxID=2975941 RepID=UPI00225A94BC|nr:hypothetical protein [Streptomyces sp. NBC_01789]MCX4451711.1 hypothetical protein [Streptomyces sp. NBC_01789]
MSGSAVAGVSSEVLVGRCYTRARRHPLMIGRWPGGRGRIWGGPYTVPQVIVLAGSLTLLLLTRALWAHFGLLNYVIALGLPYGLSLLVRHVQVDGRNPLSVAASSVGLLTRPAGGRLGGRPVKAVRGRRPLIGVCSITWAPETAHGHEGGSPSVRHAARSRTAVPRPMNPARRSTGPRSSVARDQNNVLVPPPTGGVQAAEQEAAGAGAAVERRRPVPVAAALLAARRREIREDVSDPRVARRGV